ncbi:MAG TPA: hypothetical protein VFT99_13600, partial [Roseiflexaceae bacterium]|nr:hypothetical protein [Roseiflexaceae bacterium]
MNDITIVHHVSPDLDSLVASFLSASFLVAPGERVQYEFVSVGTAGQSLLPSRIVVAGRGARRVAGHSKLAEASAAHVLFAYIAEHGVRNATPSFEPADAIALVAYARAERMYTNGVDGLLAEAGGDIRSPAASLLRQVGLGRLVAGLHAMARVQALPGSENDYVLAAWNPIASSICLSARHHHLLRIPALTPSLSLFAGDDN